MAEIHAEKINYLYSTDETDKPIARYGISSFPVSNNFILQSLLFDFEIDKTYQIVISIRNSENISIVETKNIYKLDKTTLNDISFTNKEHTRASTVIKIHTPIVNIVAEDIYEFTLSVNDSNDINLDTKKTYAAIQQDN
ncbi:hypothetical protein [Lactiplantibacillus herbarum]|uniref:hypothetical protein n=1 Tax=Lactiplantibacillus herbarum TaxID=1670446 RepID=UPI00064EFBAC|nr:hypothetical protein [Lactiplantibacillus herbarum]